MEKLRLLSLLSVFTVGFQRQLLLLLLLLMMVGVIANIETDLLFLDVGSESRLLSVNHLALNMSELAF